jgi:hypothetical protein
MDAWWSDLVVAELDQVHARVAGGFARAEPRAREYLSGLVAGLAGAISMES